MTFTAHMCPQPAHLKYATCFVRMLACTSLELHRGQGGGGSGFWKTPLSEVNVITRQVYRPMYRVPADPFCTRTGSAVRAGVRPRVPQMAQPVPCGPASGAGVEELCP
jgi:hypothetical protein